MKYTKPSGKDGRLTFGNYPIITLQEARAKRTQALKLIEQGNDPSEIFCRRKKSATTYNDIDTVEAVAMEWFDTRKHDWSKNHIDCSLSRMKRFIFPLKGKMKISEMKAKDFLDILRTIEQKGLLDTVHKVKEICGMFMRYAVITERVTHDPTAALKGVLKTPQTRHMSAMTDAKDLASLLRMIDGYSGAPFVRIGQGPPKRKNKSRLLPVA